jgi:transcriptional regulator with XRE-family HTH domain
MTTKGMSLRKLAKELGVSHTLLVLWRQGKRSLAPEIEARYHELAPAHVTNLIKSPVLYLAELTAPSWPATTCGVKMSQTVFYHMA